VDYELVVVGASLGGLAAVSKLLEVLPEELDAAVVLAQHRSAEGPRLELERLLQRYTAREVAEVLDKQPIAPRHVYVAPPDYHLLVQVSPRSASDFVGAPKIMGTLALSTDDRVMYARPSIDVLFESAADAYGERAIGIVLTGANADGAVGLSRIRAAGGVAIVQDPATAVASRMPASVLAATDVDAVLPVAEMGKFLYGLAVSPAGVRA
jgi:two-component system chemotaxis response regulator CheB